jgi:hypothetical protein
MTRTVAPAACWYLSSSKVPQTIPAPENVTKREADPVLGLFATAMAYSACWAACTRFLYDVGRGASPIVPSGLPAAITATLGLVPRVPRRPLLPEAAGTEPGRACAPCWRMAAPPEKMQHYCWGWLEKRKPPSPKQTT